MINSYEEIDGMFGYEDVFSEVIASLYKGERLKIVEIGAWLGRSSFYLVEKNHEIADIYIVDRWEGTLGGVSNPEAGDASVAFMENMKKWHGHFTPIRQDSAKAAENFKDGELDFVFIDADHDYNAVCKDIDAWMPKVKVGGILAGHDYNIYQGVNDAVRDKVGEVKVYQYSWVYHKTK